MRKLRQASNSRRDLRVYGMLLVGAMFVYAGLTIDPASNCDASGRQCAPWLVPAAFFMGVALAGSALAMLVHARNWGSRLDIQARTLWWWDNAMGSGEHAIALDDIARIRVQRPEENADRIFPYRHDGTLSHFPSECSVPYAALQRTRDHDSHQQ
ncbi:hypothetical protein [Pseudoxanthomonas sp.]|jgi:hypothetical protein|uniref:hypothetical protein n=1 Tax=Pseudoxanthomonas sp. TaxID=1871049 RepID=UPI002FE31DFE